MMRCPLLAVIALLFMSGCVTTPDFHNEKTPLVKAYLGQPAGGGTTIVTAGRTVRVVYCAKDDCDETSGGELPGPSRDQLKQALEETWALIQDERFQSRVRADNQWYAAAGNDKTVSGVQLLAVYPGYIPSFTILVKDGSLGVARALTNVQTSVITVSSSMLVEWAEDKRKPGVINTLVHEMSHLISQQLGQDTSYAFMDGGFSGYPCKQAHLVSYKLGHMAECTYRNQSGPHFNRCVDDLHHDMAIPWYTYPWGWWRAFCPAYELK